MKRVFTTAGFLVLAVVASITPPKMIAQNLGAQHPEASRAGPIFAESFRHGPTRVTEQSFEIKMNPQNARYRERIKDLAGNDRYEVTVFPQSPEGDTQITSWHVQLKDLHHAIYDNILRAAQEPSSDPKNNLWWLNPDGFAPVPVLTGRIIKVDNFYVWIKVKAFHFTPLDSPYLDSMTLEVKFSNTDPRDAP